MMKIKEIKNKMKIEFLSLSENEALARVTVSAFVAQLDPTVEEIADIKTAVSEAVTNAIIHGYGEESGIVTLSCLLSDNELTVKIIDEGRGIKDIKKALEPLYTTAPDAERSGMGFTVMESFMDSVEIESVVNKGTTVTLKKYIGKNESVQGVI